MLNANQLLTLKNDILADSELNAIPNTPDGAFAIATVYSQVASPDFWVWRTSIEVLEIMQNGFDWTRVDNLTVGKARIWDWMMRTGMVRMSYPNVRSGVIAVFGTAGDLATRQAIFNAGQRRALRVEKLFATGAGTSTTDQGVGPATMTFEGNLSYQDVLDARNS